MGSLKTNIFCMYRNTHILNAFFKFNRNITTMLQTQDKWNYNDSVSLLNSLQSNAATVQAIKERIRRREDCVNITETWKYLNRIGVKHEDLKRLSVVHIAGTKGKGTTSAMCESILRHHGYRTGLYTSPHLVSVTERIQIEGKQLSKDNFADHFSRVYGNLHSQQDYEGDMPKYFMFLTVLAFDVFLREKVDVAVVEVGIGGEYDITNVVNNVVTAGITSLGLEHTAILGNTIEHIAREKGGIMKNGCTAFTVNQPPNALNVLKNIALTRNCPLTIVPDFDSYIWESGVAPKLAANVPVFKLNASMAIQLAHTWMSNHTNVTENGNNIFTNLKLYSEKKSDRSNSESNDNYDNKDMIECFVNKDNCIRNIPTKTAEAISSCIWPGRCQTLSDKYVDYYIDGAHTLESIGVCVEWFTGLKRSSSKKILIFNITGDRDSEVMLTILAKIGFDLAIFTPNIAYRNRECVDQISNTSCKDAIATCQKNLEIWKRLYENVSKDGGIVDNFALTMNCVEDAIDHVRIMYGEEVERPQVLFTGSLHLIGAALAVLTS